MKVHIRFWVNLMILFSLVSCATVQSYPTISGRPEIFIENARIDKVKSHIVDRYMNFGYGIERESDHQVVLKKYLEGSRAFMYKALVGNAYSSDPYMLLIFNLVGQPNGVRVLANVTTVMQNAFGRVDTNDLTNGKAGAEVYEYLQYLKSVYEGQKLN